MYMSPSNGIDSSSDCGILRKSNSKHKLVKNFTTVKIKKTGRVGCGGALETRLATCHNWVTHSYINFWKIRILRQNELLWTE